ncbi:helix-turn-helix domain-containing protein [Flavisolibacter ginsenosidimutans]|uniref:Helix-turn-helix domain-containing protein n=2 Tax=Flavisolibacter ginsenosidimutans TaxID=661481 RepID=A0A5B8UNW3_9BACT|nr:helix-turn-helix domain-containing protein [Flavisolibacter ginsenosidimutans]
MDKNNSIPILIPLDPNEFWTQMRGIIREEMERSSRQTVNSVPVAEIPGLTEKPLYNMREICSLFRITKPTIYDWIKHGKLRRIKIRSRVYFLGSEIKHLMEV